MARETRTEAELDQRHAEKMRKRKAARERMLATKTIEKGLLIVHTGKGKGKSTAAFGLAARAIGNGMKVGVVQFVKGKWATGERAVLERFPDLITVRVMGEGFTWDTQDRQRDIAAAKKAWESARSSWPTPPTASWCWTSSTSCCATTISTSTRCSPGSPRAIRTSTSWSPAATPSPR